jgi:hypothetical protein
MNEILLPAQVAGKQKWDFNNRGPFSTDPPIRPTRRSCSAQPGPAPRGWARSSTATATTACCSSRCGPGRFRRWRRSRASAISRRAWTRRGRRRPCGRCSPAAR